jgi:transketolase
MPENNVATAYNKNMANAIRALSMDAIQKANSGHPGMPMGMADVATVLYSKHLKFDPKNPRWPDRDRFVLSAGHGSMLLYSLLHLTGYENPTIDDLKNFRQLHHPCAGHPEFGMLDGIETTTGPLGQGLATAVGMALAERMQAAHFGDDIVDHHTYVVAGDGCLMEGISHEAISMAGHWKLGKMIVLWDDNDITIDGAIGLSCSDDQQARFEAHNWHVQSVDGHNFAEIDAALEKAKADPRPSMIACKTIIGYGSPNKQGTSATHGAPLGDAEIIATRAELGWNYPAFEIPDDIRAQWLETGKRGNDAKQAWDKRFAAMASDNQNKFNRQLNNELPAELSKAINQYKKDCIAKPKKIATRSASQAALEVINSILDNTVAGSADLTGSNNTNTSQTIPISADDFSGRYIYYGIREFGMSAVMNGLNLHGGFIPYGGTFLVFTDYARAAMRLSALMNQGVIYVMTHDSIGLGEDGPTHQPVEHVPSLRLMPGINVYRPCDVVETAECWELAIKDRTTPSVLALTRQGLDQQRLHHSDENLCGKGGYVLKETDNAIVTIVATGSEVAASNEAAKILTSKNIATRIVSMPCTELFDKQSDEYKSAVLGKGALRVSVEAAATGGWAKYVGLGGISIGIDSFGESAPADQLFDHFGLTPQKIAERIENHLKKTS